MFLKSNNFFEIKNDIDNNFLVFDKLYNDEQIFEMRIKL